MADTIAMLQAIVTADVKGLIDGLAKSKKEMSNFGAAAGGAMAVASKAIDIAIDAVQAFGDATVGAAVRFDKSLKNIQAVTGQTSAEIKALGGELMAIGAKSVAGTQAVTDAYYDVASGVTNAAARMATLKAAVALSEAGNASLASSTQALISVMNSYSFAADKAGFASDVLTRTVGLGVGTMEAFAGALGPIAGIAAKVGVKFDELGASAAFLTTKGASASQAATRLQAAMVSMLNPNAQMTAALRKAGFASGEAAIKQLGLAGAVNALMKASGGSTEAMAKMAGSVEALQAMAALAGPEFAEFSKQFADGLDGATAAAQKVQLGSFDAQWKMLTNSLGTAAQAVGMLVLPALNGLISFFNNAVGVVGKFGPQISQALAKVTGIFQPLIDEIMRVTGPIRAELFNIQTAFTTFFSKLFDEPAKVIQGDSIVNKITTTGKTMQEKIGPAFEQLKYTIGEQLSKIDLVSLGTGLINAFASFGETLARNILKGILDLGTRLVSGLQAQFAGVDVVAKAGELMTKAGQFGAKLIDNLLSGLTDIVTKVGDAVGKIDTVDIGAKAGKFLADALAFGAKLIGKLVSGLFGIDTQVGTEVGAQLDKVDLLTRAGNLLGKVLEVGTKLIAKFAEGIASLGASFGAEIVKNLNSIDLGAAIQKLLTDAATNAQKLVGQFISGISALGNDFGFKIADNLKSIDVGAAAKSLLDGALKIGKDIIDKAVSGVSGLATGLIKAITDELDKVISAIKAKAEEIGAAIASAVTGKTVTVNSGGGGGKPIPGGVGISGGQRAGGPGNMLGGLSAALEGQDQAAGAADLTATLQQQIDNAVTNLQPPKGLTEKLMSFFSGADITAALTNLGTTISASIATTFGPDGVVMAALMPFADSWAQMFGEGGTMALAATSMIGMVDQLTAALANVPAVGVPAMMDLEAASTSGAPAIVASWQPVVAVFESLARSLDNVTGKARAAVAALGGVGTAGAGAAGGGRGYAEGGYTGSGSSSTVAGYVHKNEYVVPSNGALVMRGGDSGGAISIQNVNVYGVQSPAAMYDAIRKEAQRRNA